MTLEREGASPRLIPQGISGKGANQTPLNSSVCAVPWTLLRGCLALTTRPQAACCPSKFNPLKSLLNALYPNLLLGNPFDIIDKYVSIVMSEGYSLTVLRHMAQLAQRTQAKPQQSVCIHSLPHHLRHKRRMLRCIFQILRMSPAVSSQRSCT